MKAFDTRDASLVPYADWNAIWETRYLLAVPGMSESIKAGLAEPSNDVAKSLDW
jgi:PHD/YefM family antitoxin component YafN of YafNO toxin-antitoxin module